MRNIRGLRNHVSLRVGDECQHRGIVALAAATSLSAGEKWHGSLEDGVSAARKSGRPILVVTAWKSGI